jgi:putative Mg2+ transporter-C (MgtC) family protein
MNANMPVEIWLFRLVVAVVLGGIVGFERQYHGRPAGLRTHILVCMGSALITMAGIALIASQSTMGETIRSDPARIAAGVITGIGFLGGGVIMRTRDHVRGLTTAASIWFIAGLGVVIGLGLTLVALVATVIEQITLISLAALEKMMPVLRYRDLMILAAGSNIDVIEKSCRDVLQGFRIRVQDVECELVPATNQVKLVFHLQMRGQRIHNEIIRKLGAINGVTQIVWRTNVQQA